LEKNIEGEYLQDLSGCLQILDFTAACPDFGSTQIPSPDSAVKNLLKEKRISAMTARE
jgi:hypothetical protein